MERHYNRDNGGDRRRRSRSRLVSNSSTICPCYVGKPNQPTHKNLSGTATTETLDDTRVVPGVAVDPVIATDGMRPRTSTIRGATIIIRPRIATGGAAKTMPTTVRMTIITTVVVAAAEDTTGGSDSFFGVEPGNRESCTSSLKISKCVRLSSFSREYHQQDRNSGYRGGGGNYSPNADYDSYDR